MSELGDYKNPRVKVNTLLKKSEIIRVKKGLYIFGPEYSRAPYSKETLANLIYGPSYISLEYALSFYGLIPERVETVTSITNKRKKIFHTPVGIFSYRYINPSYYPDGITLLEQDEFHSILIATKEKALADMLYFSEKMNAYSQIEKYLFENLRLEKDVLQKLDLKKMKKLAGMYGKNVILFYHFLEKIK